MCIFATKLYLWKIKGLNSVLRDNLVDVEDVHEVEKEAGHVADEEDDDDAHQHHGQVHLAGQVFLPDRTMYICTSMARFISRVRSFFLTGQCIYVRVWPGSSRGSGLSS